MYLSFYSSIDRYIIKWATWSCNVMRTVLCCAWNEVPICFQVFRGTITDASNCNPGADAEALYNAMKGMGECLKSACMILFSTLLSLLIPMYTTCFPGSDKEAILDLITSRSNAQRQEIIAAYKCKFGKVHHIIYTHLCQELCEAYFEITSRLPNNIIETV